VSAVGVLADVVAGRSQYALIHADCLDPWRGLACLPDRSVQHCITDPPYDDHTHKSGRRGHTGYIEGQSSARATFNRARTLGFEPLTDDTMAGVAAQIARTITRWSMPFCTIEMVGDSAIDDGRGWRAAQERAGLDYVRTSFWRKVGAAPQFTGDRPAQAAEAIVMAHQPGRKRWNGGGKHGWYEHNIVLERGNGVIRLHTTQKPLPLMEELVTDFTDPGDIVIDPFMGSGTTGVACLRLGRRFIGWERDAAYYEIACRRLRGDEAKPRKEQPGLFDDLHAQAVAAEFDRLSRAGKGAA
jgi:hypothetical protein